MTKEVATIVVVFSFCYVLFSVANVHNTLQNNDTLTKYLTQMDYFPPREERAPRPERRDDRRDERR